MKKLLSTVLCATTLLSHTHLSADEDINLLAEQTDELYRVGAASQDGAFTSLSLSMLGWGLGIITGIGVLASVLSQSSSSNSHESCNTHDY